jgi:hypothetical protein
MASACLLLALSTTAAALKASLTIPEIPDANVFSQPEDAVRQFTVQRMPLRGNLEPMSKLEVVDSVIELKRGDMSSLSSMYVQAIRAQAGGGTFNVSRVVRICVLRAMHE